MTNHTVLDLVSGYMNGESMQEKNSKIKKLELDVSRLRRQMTAIKYGFMAWSVDYPMLKFLDQEDTSSYDGTMDGEQVSHVIEWMQQNDARFDVGENDDGSENVTFQMSLMVSTKVPNSSGHREIRKFKFGFSVVKDEISQDLPPEGDQDEPRFKLNKVETDMQLDPGNKILFAKECREGDVYMLQASLVTPSEDGLVFDFDPEDDNTLLWPRDSFWFYEQTNTGELLYYYAVVDKEGDSTFTRFKASPLTVFMAGK